jgi:hypothetical protein
MMSAHHQREAGEDKSGDHEDFRSNLAHVASRSLRGSRLSVPAAGVIGNAPDGDFGRGGKDGRATQSTLDFVGGRRRSRLPSSVEGEDVLRAATAIANAPGHREAGLQNKKLRGVAHILWELGEPGGQTVAAEPERDVLSKKIRVHPDDRSNCLRSNSQAAKHRMWTWYLSSPGLLPPWAN